MTRPSGIPCGACGGVADDPAGSIPFYLKSGEIDTRLWRCGRCGTYTREIDLDDPRLRGHFEVASYTDPQAEARLRDYRAGFFAYLQSLAEAAIGRSLHGLRVLDVGAAYGHFLDRLLADGAQGEGVEIVEALRAQMAARGLVVHATVPTAVTAPFDVIFAIDSLYYFNDPQEALAAIRRIISPEGRLIIRVTNRVWLLDWLRVAGVAIGRDRFGDAKCNFSPEGMALLLQRAGFEPTRLIWREKGKRGQGRLLRLYYTLSAWASEYLTLPIAPGMIFIARPRM